MRGKRIVRGAGTGTESKLVAAYKRAVLNRNHVEGRKVLRVARKAGCAWAWSK